YNRPDNVYMRKIMSKTYNAILYGDHLEWSDPPPELNGREPVAVQVIILDEAGGTQQAESPGEQLGAILEQLAALGAFVDIDDPVAWQREIRQDRPLPGREP